MWGMGPLKDLLDTLAPYGITVGRGDPARSAYQIAFFPKELVILSKLRIIAIGLSK